MELEEWRFDVTVTASPGVPVRKYVAEVLSQLNSVDAIESVELMRLDQNERDISEVEDIISDLSTEELDSLRGSIEYYTEGEE